jgi:uncharacterized protein HemX
MPLTVACPKCQARLDITSDLADQPIRCHRCEHVFTRGDDRHAEAIQVGTSRNGAPPRTDDDEPVPPSRPHATARAPFPTAPILVLVCGLLFLLLALSVGFNVYILAQPDREFGMQAARRAEQEARLQAERAQADAAAQAAQVKAQAAQADEAKLRREIENLRDELAAVRQDLDDARRKADKADRDK